MAHEGQNQPYDNVLKRMMEKQAEVILPLLLPELAGRSFEQLTIEMLIPSRRGDCAYMTTPRDPREEPEVIHIEYEVAPDKHSDKTLNVYRAILWEKYRKQVHSYLFYPFETTSMPEPPLRQTRPNGTDEYLFDYVAIKFWELDARSFVAQDAVPLYGLLPCMSGTSAELLSEAITRMVEWYGDHTDLLSDELVCFYTVLQRAHRLPEEDVSAVIRRLQMHDDLLDNAPWVQEKVAVKVAEARVKTFKDAILAFVKEKFPPLEELAEAKVARMNQPEALQVLLVQLYSAADEHAVRDILEAR